MTSKVPDLERLQGIRDLDSLVDYLRDELDWPLDKDVALEEAVFEYTPEEVHLDDAQAAKINKIWRFRPLDSSQPWGIFYIDFNKEKLPITVLRRILRALVVKKRESANDNQAWQAGDLLFISTLGDEEHRSINLAHFGQDADGGAVLRVVDWAEEDSHFHMLRTAGELDCLRWPDDPRDHGAWREQWGGAFRLKPGQVAKTSKMLATQMASLARLIRSRVNAAMEVESPSGPLKKMYKAFKEVLVSDLTPDSFADMYAQTMTYGLFAAKRSRPAGFTNRTAQETVRDLIPNTNPFLRDLLAEFTEVSGMTKSLDFDELGIDALVQTLEQADMDAVLADFDDKNPEEDPVIHFYEDFLRQYDKKMKVQRGVFFTPRPVVSFIVRSVHELLQKEFGLEDGLADTSTWSDMQKRFPDIKLPQGAAQDMPFVQILDPAVGTGTFLVEVIDVIHRTMVEKWMKRGMKPMDIHEAWNDYVPAQLLPRLYGFELMMASYTVAHMKIALKLESTGFRFMSGERTRVYLTNALESGVEVAPRFRSMAPALAQQAGFAAEAKGKVFTVLVGNPPYSRASANRGAYIEGLCDDFKKAVQDEKNIQPLSDDYIKFWRIAMDYVSGYGLISLITNNSFLSGRLHRGMRQQLMHQFPRAWIVDLHGSSKVAAPSSDDQNVFDIQQGVAVSCFALTPQNTHRVSHGDLVGTRTAKYRQLAASTLERSSRRYIEPRSDFYWLVPREGKAVDAEFQRMVSLSDLFVFHNVSGKPGDDELLVSINKEDVLPKLSDRTRTKSASQSARRYWEREWTITSSKVEAYAYRPFDHRWTYYDRDIWARAVPSLKARIQGQVVLLTTRIVKDDAFRHAFVTRVFPDVILLSNTSSVNCYSFPSCVPGTGQAEEFHAVRPELLGMDQTASGCMKFLHWVYAVLHAPSYRARYGEQLSYDFPRIPRPMTSALLEKLSALGADLVALHLMEDDYSQASWYLQHTDSPLLATNVTLSGTSRMVANKFPQHDGGRVCIGSTSSFGPIEKQVWDFRLGSYRICEKWLKDRRGQPLTDEDIAHYGKIVVAIRETIRIMGEIDAVIEEHGGWPGAFETKEAAS